MHDDRHAPELNQHAPLEKLLNRSKRQFPLLTGQAPAGSCAVTQKR